MQFRLSYMLKKRGMGSLDLPYLVELLAALYLNVAIMNILLKFFNQNLSFALHTSTEKLLFKLQIFICAVLKN